MNSEACYKAKDHDSADLCAQWRAAIAAEKSAHEAERATTWSIIATVLSGFGLACIVWSLRQTSGALKAAQEGNRLASIDHARARDEARAWLSLSIEPIRVSAVDQSLRFYYRVCIENKGSLVATNLNVLHTVIHRGHGIESEIASHVAFFESKREPRAAVASPGEVSKTSVWAFRNRSDFGLDPLTKGNVDAVVLLYAMYNVGDDKTPRFSRKTVRLGDRCDVEADILTFVSDPVRPFIAERDLPLGPPRLVAEDLASAAS